jgi:mRNA interferase HigB
LRIIARKTLVAYWTRAPNAESGLAAWFTEVRAASWSSPADVKAKYGNASILKGGRVVFNIAGNKYRLVVWIRYEFHTVYIRFVGTHQEYNKIDAETV